MIGAVVAGLVARDGGDALRARRAEALDGELDGVPIGVPYPHAKPITQSSAGRTSPDERSDGHCEFERSQITCVGEGE
nr:MAG: hypothetical protein DIU78_08420 [Pseudomonadota bacterium]